ncbi:MAG: SIMPL domain-containing protein [bacterium]
MLTAILLAAVVAAPTETPRTIQVSGTAEVTVAPDICYISFGVTAEHKSSAALAYRDNTAVMAAVVAAIRALDIPDNDIKTANLTISPSYRWDDKDRRPQFEGYEVNNTLAVSLRDITRVSNVLDAAVAAGATTVSNVRFTVENPKQYLTEARVEAVRAAKAKAGAMAEAAGARLGAVRTILEHEVGGYGRLYAQSNVAAERGLVESVGAGDAVSPGDVRLSQSVTATFELH